MPDGALSWRPASILSRPPGTEADPSLAMGPLPLAVVAHNDEMSANPSADQAVTFKKVLWPAANDLSLYAEL